MIKYIESKTNKIVLETIKLKDNKYSKEKRLFIIEGFHLFSMSKNIKYIFTLNKIDNLDENIDQYIVNEEILRKISSNKNPQPIIAVASYLNGKIEENPNIIFYLDNVQDPGNVGTFIRSALAFNFKNILLSYDSAFKYNLKTIQASQGSIFDSFIESTSINKLKELKEKGYIIISTCLDKNSIKLNDFNFNKNEKYVIVFGNEGQGIREEILSMSDKKIYINISNIDSLNISCSASILMYVLNNSLN